MQVHKTFTTAQLAEEVIARCQKLASFSEDASRICRTFLSPPMHDVHRELGEWLRTEGAHPNIDAAGNLRAVYPGDEESAPRLLIGSHLDTVPNAGAYDGILGVVIAVALLKALDGRRMPFAIEVVGFSDEEGVRFRTPFIGSRAAVGRLDSGLLETHDAHGISVKAAIEQFGLNPREIAQACVSDDAVGYLEFHIEQGPVLEKLGMPLAVVDAVAGQSRLEFEFLGQANHAGTTPMDMRRDALAAAAEWVTTVEQEAKQTPGIVATVGSIQVSPGATNVIAGEARVSLDVRHSDDNTRKSAVEKLIDQAEGIARRRRLSLKHRVHLSQPAVAMDNALTDHVTKAIEATGCKLCRMISGAGHDAMIMAEKVPAAMIFLRTPGGISHDPGESVAVEDVAKAIECGLHLLDRLAASQTRTNRG